MGWEIPRYFCTTAMLWKWRAKKCLWCFSHMVMSVILNELICIIVYPPSFTALLFCQLSFSALSRGYPNTRKRTVCLAAVTDNNLLDKFEKCQRSSLTLLHQDLPHTSLYEGNWRSFCYCLGYYCLAALVYCHQTRGQSVFLEFLQSAGCIFPPHQL